VALARTEEGDMPTYVILTNFTEQGIKNIKELPGRLAENETRLQEAGGKLVGWYGTFGQYDAVVIVEAPSDEAVAGMLLALGMQGNTRTTTLKAFPREEFEKIIRSLP
jgi:uncharacterized protein with GYD domain